MTWWHWCQNNSGGFYITDNNLAENVYIEADLQEEAEAKAFAMGIYYDGVSNGRDCECCGDRWGSPDEVYGSLQDVLNLYNWGRSRLFHRDGRIEEVK